MGLAPGTRLGPCEVTAPIGVGGMGECTVRTTRGSGARRDQGSATTSDPRRVGTPNV
jgi:hypothetical protein